MRQTLPTRKAGRSTPLPWPGLDQSIAAFGRPSGRGWVGNGYYTVGWRTHPLSSADARVAVHRAVSWEAAGFPDPGEAITPCSLCRFRLPWRLGSLRPRANRYVVNVGFLNADSDDVRPENLAAFCYWCNANRGWLSRCRPGSWGYLDSCKHIAPWQRPSLPAALHLAAAVSEGFP